MNYFMLMKYMQKDDQLRQLVMLTLICKKFRRGQSLLVPDGMLVQPVPGSEFDRAVDTYAGLPDANTS